MTGVCECGCGGQTKQIPRNRPLRGYVKGQFYRFIAGHNPKSPPKPPLLAKADATVRHIPLSKGYVALVDPGDYERANHYVWHALVCRHRDGSLLNVYAVRNRIVDGKRTSLLLHRFLLGIDDPAIEIDHRNHDGLDCRRQNLRACSKSQNQGNTRLRKDNTSGVKGVYLHKATGKWAAAIGNSLLGLFDSKPEAEQEYDQAARERFGEFAHTSKSA